MPKYTKILNKKLYVTVFLLFIFYGLITSMAAYYTYDNYVKYGVYYSAVIQTLFTSDFFINLSIVILMFVTTVVLLVCARQNTITLERDPKSQDSSSYGIDFPNGRPQSWDISVNMETQNLEVTLDGKFVAISKDTINNLFKGVIQKQ